MWSCKRGFKQLGPGFYLVMQYIFSDGWRKNDKSFGLLLMFLSVCSKQIPDKQHLTYQATNEAHSTTNTQEKQEEDLEVNVRDRLTLQLPVLFPFNPTAQVANVKQLTLKEGSDLREFIRIINADTIFANQSRTLAESRGRYFRLDMQIVIIGGQRYHNLQVQRNGKFRVLHMLTYWFHKLLLDCSIMTLFVEPFTKVSTVLLR